MKTRCLSFHPSLPLNSPCCHINTFHLLPPTAHHLLPPTAHHLLPPTAHHLLPPTAHRSHFSLTEEPVSTARAIRDTYALGSRALNYVKNKTELWRETCSYMEASIPFPQSLTEPGDRRWVCTRFQCRQRDTCHLWSILLNKTRAQILFKCTWNITNTEYTLGHKTSLNKCKRIQICSLQKWN